MSSLRHNWFCSLTMRLFTLAFVVTCGMTVSAWGQTPYRYSPGYRSHSADRHRHVCGPYCSHNQFRRIYSSYDVHRPWERRRPVLADRSYASTWGYGPWGPAIYWRSYRPYWSYAPMWWGYRPWWNYPAGYWYLRPWYRYQTGFWSIAPSQPAANELESLPPSNGPQSPFPNTVPPGPDEAAEDPVDIHDPRLYGAETDDPVLRRYRVGREGFWYGESRFIR